MSTREAPALVGVVIAGGQSRRMGQDKGALDYHGRPQAEHCYRLLQPRCARVFVSVNREQSARDPYRSLPLLEDEGSVAGPAAGLVAAWTDDPSAALLTLAVDLPLVDDDLLDDLIAQRNPVRAATAWVHPDGVVEPLCTIWEPAMRAVLIDAARGRSPSLRRLLEAADVERLTPKDPRRLASVNTEHEYRELVRELGAD